MVIIKNYGEIKNMKEGGEILASILYKLKFSIRPGISTKELDNLAEEMAKKHKVQPSFKGYKGYPSSLCVAVNNEVVHGLPGSRRLSEGDIIGLDFGLKYKGLYTDSAITVGVGKISSKAKKLLQVTEKSLYIGISQVKIGNHIGDISSAIQSYVESQGFSVVRDLVGHGVGKHIHEDPQIPNFGKPKQGIKLKKGMTFCIEPMVNIGGPEIKQMSDGWTFVTKDGSLSAHFEHSVALTDKGCEILTLFNK